MVSFLPVQSQKFDTRAVVVGALDGDGKGEFVDVPTDLETEW